ncbi:inner centromere protein isoform X3 [Heterocephalus glaber]|uniref:Inner centromere protein n=1 Tax=Heterocephalus glaber TaxID=10181 RepID=A0AAX6SGE8_HETGA|nr:inner centromere protein isoform X3 [Heterocephalus glaber]
MGTAAPGPIHLLDLCDQKLMDFVYNMDKDLVWLKEIQEEAERMFTREFSKEPELMPKTPSQKNRRRKRRVSYVQDENRDPIRKRSSHRKIRSGRLSSRHLRGKDKVEKLATVVGDQGSPVLLRRMTRAAAAAAAAARASAALERTLGSPVDRGQVPVVEIGTAERHSAEQRLAQLRATPSPLQAAPPALAEDSTPAKSGAGSLESVTVSTLVTTPQDPRSRGAGTGRSACKLRIARAGGPSPQDSPHCPDSPWRGRVLAPIQPNGSSTAAGSQPVRRSLIAPGPQDALAQEYTLVAQQEGTHRRLSRSIAQSTAPEPATSARIICHSYLERLLNVEVPQRVGMSELRGPCPLPGLGSHSGRCAFSPRQEEPGGKAEPMVAVAEPEDPGSGQNTLLARGATDTAVRTPNSQPAPGGREMAPEGQQQGVAANNADGRREQPQSVRRKRSYKRAMSDLEEEPSLVDEDLQPPRSKTPSPPGPGSKVVRPLRTFLHTVQRNQMLMAPGSAPRRAGMTSFIKRNTPLRVDPKCSFVEKERQRLESLRRKEEAEQLRRQKVEEERRRRREEEKLKREERHRKVLQARERVEQLKEEKKKQMEQRLAQLEEKTEKAKEERQAEEKAKQKAEARRRQEAEARRRQEEEARGLRRLRQEEEERRHQELLQKRKEEEQERLRKAAEARRLAEQQEQERRREQERLQADRELQEREKALQLHRELEKKAQEEQQRLAEQRLQEEQEQKAREAAAASKALNVTVESPACTSYQMTPQGHRRPPKINPDNYCNYGMDLNSDDSTDDEAQPRKPIPAWARGTQLSQAIVHQYYHPPSLAELFGTIAPLDLEDIFKKSKPRYHKRTSSAVWNSPPLQGIRLPGSLACSLKKY